MQTAGITGAGQQRAATPGTIWNMNPSANYPAKEYARMSAIGRVSVGIDALCCRIFLIFFECSMVTHESRNAVWLSRRS